ncbi:hypothetical protein B296_00040343 [Ensete ventricosum]|uniref:Kinesin motor domain-containing protein n=1 Tax=Ensete ventricosum TaxID=4639 RepID=A0A426ZQT6_ENSVE|nr:hypothetical protein B296_00040343 [Ensete ventricosum]
MPICTPGGSRVEEKIFVTVRVRPLSRKELSLKDQEAWECIDDNKIVFKMSSQDRSNSPSSYTFDRVFGPTCLTERVYEEGAKNVALSALTGINATIFAYGQTSSGKTFTMRGITENAVNDIYKHINNTPERDFTIKISAMEIYNEIVRDLLKPDSGGLRLLDDPERGTIVDKLEEETAKDSQHLRYLIGTCEAQRQVGETALNDNSSRSHQIIRLVMLLNFSFTLLYDVYNGYRKIRNNNILFYIFIPQTVESTLHENSDCVKSFVATLVSYSYWFNNTNFFVQCSIWAYKCFLQNFVDLAGSERAGQTHASGARLKEGCHINRSLLNLTTVIRTLR